MTPDAPIPWIRSGFRCWRRLISLLPLLTVLLFLVSNLLISGPWTRHWIRSWVQEKIKLPPHVGGFTWSPWRGVAIHSLQIEQPEALRASAKEPLLSIAEIRFTPSWRALFRGRLEANRITLVTPRLLVPIEIITHLFHGATVAAPPVAVAATPSATPPLINPPAVSATPSIAPPPPPAISPAPAAPAAADANKPPSAILPTIPPQPTTWVDLENASFAVVAGNSGMLLAETSGVTGSIPIFGDSAQSTLTFASISVGGLKTKTKLSTQLSWAYPIFSVLPFETQLGPYPCRFSAQLATLPLLPLQLEAQVPPQALAPIPLPFASRLSADSFAANARFRGFILSPGSWDGDFRTEVKSATLQIADQVAHFDSGSSITLLRGGALSCVDARLVSDDLSILGNGILVADGRLAGVARVVSRRDTVESITRRILPQVPGPRPLTELGTPQRVAFDLEAAGNLNQLVIRLGKDGPILQVQP